MESFDIPELFKTYTMGITDTISYVLFKNPVSTTVIDSSKYIGNSIWSFGLPVSHGGSVPSAPPIPKALQELAVQRIVFSGSPYIRLAGLSGAIAVLIGAYGAHSLLVKPGLEERKRIYETANRYHFIHTLALLGVPLSRCPKTVCTFMSLGMIVFCGACYYDAFTGNTQLRKYTPAGGTLLVVGWICFML